MGGTLRGMTGSDPRADLHRYLHAAREALLWKLDGLSDYDVGRPLTPTGTSLLGWSSTWPVSSLGYFGDTFKRPFDEPLPWLEDDAEPNADMWATVDEAREQIVGLYHQAWRTPTRRSTRFLSTRSATWPGGQLTAKR